MNYVNFQNFCLEAKEVTPTDDCFDSEGQETRR